MDFSSYDISNIRQICQQYGSGTVWIDLVLSRKYDVACIFVGKTTKDDTKPFLQELDIAINCMNETDLITEVAMFDPEYETEMNADNGQIIGVLGQARKINYDINGSDWMKGTQSVVAVACAHVAENHGLVDESYQRLLADIERETPKGTTYGTYLLIKKIFDGISDKQMLLRYFQTDCPTMQQLRRTSPFRWIWKVPEYRQEVEDVIHDIVNNPDQYPPIPSYKLWLEKKLKKGEVGWPYKRYVPEPELSKIKIIQSEN